MKLLKTKTVSVLLCGVLLGACNQNEQPAPSLELANFTITVDENPENGQVLGSPVVSASGASLTFALSNQNPAGALAINANTGELSVANASLFDFEERSNITATLTATLGSVNRTAAITINLNDVYDSGVAFEAVIEHWKFDGNFAGAVDASRVLQQGRTDVSVEMDVTDRFGNANRAARFKAEPFLSLSQDFLVAGNGERTVSFWVKNLDEDATVTNVAFFGYGVGSSSQAFGLKHNAFPDQPSFFELYTWGGGARDLRYLDNFRTRWEHIAVSYKGGTLKIYVNGTLQETKTEVPELITPSQSTLLIGAQVAGGVLGIFALDDLIFYNRELTTDEVRALADN